MASLTAEQIFAAFDRFMRELSPEAASAFLTAVAQLREQISTSDLSKLIERGDVQAAVVAALSSAALTSALRSLRTSVRSSVIRSANRFRREIPPRRITPTGSGLLKVEFDVLDRRLITAVQNFEQDLVRETGKTLQAGVRAAIEDGSRRGINPRTIARGIRDLVGLAPNQVEYLANLRAELEGGKYGDALKRELRDRRYDALLRRLATRKEPLTAAQIEKITEAYRRRLIGQHAETVARTVSINSMKMGKRAIWQQAVDQGVVEDDQIERVWISKLDDRVRDTHREMHGKTIAMGEQWDVPAVGLVDYPGEREFNCRCVEVFRVRIRRASAA